MWLQKHTWKRKKTKLNVIKIKNFCASKSITKKVQKNPTEEEKAKITQYVKQWALDSASGQVNCLKSTKENASQVALAV